MAKSDMRFIEGVEPSGSVDFTFDGHAVTGFLGESIASALMRAGVCAQRRTRRLDQPRGYYCGMGLCWECAVQIDGHGIVRSCSYPVSSGIVVRTADGAAK